MLHIDEDDFFVGSPESKFFDVIFHANKGLVENVLVKQIDRYGAMEILLEKLSQKVDFDIEAELMNIMIDEQDALYHKKIDFYIATTGDILTQSD